MAESSLCIIVPCYNESKRLDFDRFLDFAKAHPTIRICFANDGSKDNTIDLIKNFCALHTTNFFFIDFEDNSGKAETIRKTFLQVEAQKKFSHLGYLDADLSAPPEEMARLFSVAIAHDSARMVMGTRLRRLGASVTRSFARHYLGRVFATLASMSLHLPVYDTQCGAKIIHASVVPFLFKDKFVSKWFFDIELLKRLLLHPDLEFRRTTVIEVPLNTWHAVDGSKVRLKDFLIAPLELLKIHRHYKSPDIDYDTLS